MVGRDARTAWLMVLGQVVLLGLIAALPRRHDWTIPLDVARACIVVTVIGILVMVVAATELGRGLTAAPLPNKHAQLRTAGLYRHVRHPIYTGLLLAGIAYTLPSGNGWVAAACGLLILLINFKARWEERHLERRFLEYAAYSRHTSRFIPSPRTKKFRLRAGEGN